MAIILGMLMVIMIIQDKLYFVNSFLTAALRAGRSAGKI
jgi:hypothetical protein